MIKNYSFRNNLYCSNLYKSRAANFFCKIIAFFTIKNPILIGLLLLPFLGGNKIYSQAIYITDLKKSKQGNSRNKKTFFLGLQKHAFSGCFLFMVMFVFLWCNKVNSQTTIFQFNFEGNTNVGIDNAVGIPTFATNGVGGAGYSTSNPCEGSRLYYSNDWDTGDYYRFTANTTGYSNLTFSFCNRTTNTNIGTFIVRVSSNSGASWTTVIPTFTPTGNANTNTLTSVTFPVTAENTNPVWIEIYKTSNANNTYYLTIDKATLTGYPPPTVDSFSPTSQCVAGQVVITGTNFTGATAVTIGGTNASYTVNSATQITATVGAGTTGTVSVTTPGGTATSAGTFTVIPALSTGAISNTGESICYGGSPTLTIGNVTSASGGDNAITYSWRSSADGYNTAILGATSDTYSPSGVFTTTVGYRRYAKDGLCNTTPTVSANTWTVTAEQFTPGAISATGEAVCYGGTPTAIGNTTSASGGNNVITYSWRSSADSYGADIVGATGATYTPPPGITADISYRRYANDGLCDTTPTVSANTWNITVLTPFTTGAIETTGELICYAGTPTLTIGNVTSANGGNNAITYSWRSSADGYTVAIAGATGSSYLPPPGLTANTTFRRYAKDGSCNITPTVSTNEWTVTLGPQFIPGTISNTGETICYGGTPTTTIGSVTSASGGDNVITYSWRSSADGYAVAIPGATGDTYLPTAVLTATTGYRRYANDSTCNTTPTASTNTWTVTAEQFTPGAISTTGQTICYGGTPTIIGNTTLASGGNNVITYSWRSSDDGYTADIVGATGATYTPPPGLIADVSYRRYANDGLCSTTPTVSTGTWTVTVRQQFTTGEIEATGETICYNTVPAATIGSTTVASGGNGTITYRWQYSTSPTFASGITTLAINTATYKPTQTLTQTTYYRRQAVDGICNTTYNSSTNIWQVTVRPVFASGTISNTGEIICYNTVPTVTIGSTTPASGGDGTITYQWQYSTSATFVSGVTTLAINTATYTPTQTLTQTTYYRRQANDGICNSATSSTNTWTVTVRAQFTPGTISPTGQTICYGAIATPTNIGSTTSASGGSTPITYSWRSSADSYGTAIAGATGSTYTPPAGLTTTTSYRRYARDGICNTTPEVSSNTWTVTVRPQFTTGEIEATGETICYNTVPATTIGSTTAASGGNGTITYRWQYSTSATFSFGITTLAINTATYKPTQTLTQTTYYRRQTVDGICNTTYNSSTNIWQVTVRPVFASGAITNTGEIICYNTVPTATIGSTTPASGGDGSITYQWQYSTSATFASGVTTLAINTATYKPTQTLTQTTYYRRQANDGTCNSATSSANTWIVTVRNQFTPGTISSTGQTICYGGTPTVIGNTTLASGGNNVITYSWRSSIDGYTDAIAGATSSTFTPPPGLTATTSYRRYANDGICNTTPEVSTNTWTVTVNDLFTSGAIEATGETICFGDNPGLIGNVTLASGGSNVITYSWRSDADGYTAAIGGATSSDYTPPPGLAATTTYRRYAKDDSCSTTPTPSANEWTVTVNQPSIAPSSISGTSPICNGATITLTAVGSTLGTGANYQWGTGNTVGSSPLSGETGSTLSITPTITTTYWVRIEDTTSPCIADTSGAIITITVDNSVDVAGTITGDDDVCQGQAGVAYDIPVITNATGYIWTLPPGATIVSGANTASIIVNFANNATSGDVTVKGTSSCGEGTVATFPVQVDVLPGAAGAISGTAIVCQGTSNVIYTVPPIAAVTDYIWTLPSGATIVAGDNTNSITVDYDIAAISGNITVKGNNACGDGVASSLAITVNITPYIVTNYAVSACSGKIATVTPLNGGGNIVPVGTTYSWGLPTVTGGITGATVESGQTAFNQTLTNPTNIAQTASYDVTATTAACSASTFNVLVTVNPAPTVGVTALTPLTQTICSGADITEIVFTNPNVVAGSIDYNWTRSNFGSVTGGIGISGNSETITGKLYNATSIPQTTVFTVKAYSEDLCESIIPIEVTVIVNPLPTLTVSPATQIACSGKDITPIVPNNTNGVVGTTYTWTRTTNPGLTGIPDGSGMSITGALTNTTTNPITTVFTITAVADGCGIYTTTASVTVNPTPTFDVSIASQTLCGGLPITDITAINPNAVVARTYSWSRDKTTELSGIANTGNSLPITGTFINNTNSVQTVTFTITALAGSCSSSQTTTVTVNPTPLIAFSNPNQTICSGTPITEIVLSDANNPTGTTYTWTRTSPAGMGGTLPLDDLTGTSTTINGTLTNSTSGNLTTTITVTATAANGCIRTATTNITVYPPLIDPIISDNQAVCLGAIPAKLIITNPNIGGSLTYTYQWERSTSGNPGTWTNAPGATATTNTYQPPQIPIFGGAQNYYYRVVITNSCGIKQSTAILIQVIGDAGFDFDTSDIPTNSICPGTVFTPSISSIHGDNSAVRYSWSTDSNFITPSSGGPIGTTGNRFWFLVWLRTSTGSIGPLTVQNNTNKTQITQLVVTPAVYDYANNNPQPSDFICSITPRYIDISIRPTPVATASAVITTICSGTSPSITVAGNIIDADMQFSWIRDNTTNVTGANSGTWVNNTNPTAGYILSVGNLINNTATSQTVRYTVTPRSNSCVGATTFIDIIVAPNVTPGTIANDQTICSGETPAPLTETVPTIGLTLSRQWQISTDGTNFTDIVGATGFGYAPGVLTQDTWYRRVETSTVNMVICSGAITNVVKITINNIDPGTIAGPQAVCDNSIPTVFTSVTPATGSAAPTYQWQVSTTDCTNDLGFSDISGATSENYTPTLALTATTYYRRKATSDLSGKSCSAYSNCITVTINNVTGGTVAGDQDLCLNNPAKFTQTAPSTGSGSLSYQWQSNTIDCGAPDSSWNDITLNGQNFEYDAPNNVFVNTYFRRVTISTSLDGVKCYAYSNCLTVNIISVTPGIISGNQTICSGAGPITITATAATGTSFTYQWQYSTDNAIWNNILTNGDQDSYIEPGPITQNTYYRRVVTGTINGTVTCTAVTGTMTVLVNNVTPSVISGDQSLCGSLDPGAFTVTTAATGSGTLSYQWQSNTTGCAGSWANIPFSPNSPTYDPPVISTTTYYRVMVTSTLNFKPCSVFSNCLTVSNAPKMWNGSNLLAPNDWNTAANWTPNGIPTANDCVVIPNITNQPIISSNALANSITVQNLGILTVLSNYSITVTNEINVNNGGRFLLEDSASLIQVNNVPNIVNGIFSMTRITQPMYRYDYTYWGSPLTENSNYTLGDLTPLTRADKFYSWIPSISNGNGNWAQESVATVMNPKLGYIARAPDTYSPDPLAPKVKYTAIFTGTPNNGNISADVSCGTLGNTTQNDKWNLLGNPYPSAINVIKFLEANTNIEGNISLWTHGTALSAGNPDPFYGDFTYNYSDNDMLITNGTGSVPDGFPGEIASGQGFMVSMLKASCSGSTSTVNFTNSMRSNTYDNSNFYRSSNKKQDDIDGNVEKNRIWFSMVDKNKSATSAMVGYIEGATNGNDRMYDALADIGVTMKIYSLLDNDALTIQGRALPFDANDIVPIGMKVVAPGTYSIAIDQVDGLFDSQDIYLEDKLMNVIHHMKLKQYDFVSEPGIFNDRFVLRYNTTNTLGVTNPNVNGTSVIALINNDKINIQSSENIKKVEVFDMTGKLIKTYAPTNSSKTFIDDFFFPDGVYLAKIKLENGIIESRKLANGAY